VKEVDITWLGTARHDDTLVVYNAFYYNMYIYTSTYERITPNTSTAVPGYYVLLNTASA